VSLLFLVFAVVAGALLPTQAGINAQLAKSLGHPLLAASVSFTLGTKSAIALHLCGSHPMACTQ
jgi:transporter family-2 protein